MELKCFKCTSNNLQGMKNQSGFIGLRCQDCGADNGEWANPMTQERALKFKMPFGQYKGIDLMQVARLDIQYLVWAKDNIEAKNVVDAINLVIQYWVAKKKGHDNGNRI